jgi:tetratricopeptide (TPR) repeat protein
MNMRQVEQMVINYLTGEGGHVVVVSDDRLFCNVLRKTLTQQLELPLKCLTIVSSPDQAMKICKEMSVRHRKVLVFIEVEMEYRRSDDLVRKINRRLRNAKMVVLTTETQLPKLALLREEGLAENWVLKPVVINLLLVKIAQVIKPPGELEKRIQEAEECLKNGAYRFALKACKKVFEIKPDSAVAYMIMGEAYEGLDLIEEMLDAYDNAAGLERMNFEPLRRLVSYYDSVKDHEHKLEYLERMAAESPHNIDRKIRIGGVHLDMGNEDEAAEVFDDALRLTTREELGDPSEVAVKVGDEYASRNMDEAEEYYRRALEMRGEALNESDVETFNGLGLALRKQGRWQDAIKEYKKALQVAPKSESIYYNPSLAYVDGGNYDNAYKCADYAMRLDQAFYRESPVACYNLAVIFNHAGYPEKASPLLDKALELDPGYQSARRLQETIQVRQ